MKHKIQAYLIAIIFVFSLSYPLSAFSEDSRSSEGDLYLLLSNMNIPLVDISTINGEEPTCDIVSPPEGAFGSGIANATKVEGSMKIIKNGEVIYDSGEYIKKESGLTIKIRGNTSAKKPKKPYKIKLQKKADLLNRDNKKYKDKDWVLLRTGSSLNTCIGFWASELIGQEWTPAHEFVNVFINGTYRGLYILCEQITVNEDSRININESTGYVVECDAYWWTEDIYFPSPLTNPALKFTYKYPDPEDITDEWHEAISSDVLSNEQKIIDGTYDEAYDSESFAKWLLAWEILGNDDYAGANIYMVKKDADSKIGMGPMWDFDQALKLSDGWIGIHTDYFYFHHMFKSNDALQNAFNRLWDEKGQYVVDNLIERINAFASSPEGSDYNKCLELEKEYGIGSDYWQPYIGDLEFMHDYAVTFLNNRAIWLGNKIAEIENGVEIIDQAQSFSSEENVYDMTGRRIKKNIPGLQIQSGRKIYIRP